MTTTDCERVRMALMEGLDGERPEPLTLERQHVSSCSSCAQWLAHMETTSKQLASLSYPAARTDVWPAVESEIQRGETTRISPTVVGVMAAIILTWRALELAFDLPLPMLHALVPLLTTIGAAWWLAGDPLAIETSAPELKKGGV